MATFIRMGKCPGRNDCEAAVKDPRLTTRSWKNIKYCVKNINDAQRRKNKKD